jgi:alkylation response protein AidB-like acyl-CoA dehydrogenase
VVGCFAVTEEAAGSDVRSVTSSARRQGEGWRLEGAKRFTTNVGRATHALVFGRCEGSERSAAGAASFGFYLVPLSDPGVTIQGFFPTMGVRSADTGAWAFSLDLPPEAVVGGVGSGLRILMTLLDFERAAAAAGLVASARHALDLAIARAETRHQFGMPLISNQALRHRLADRSAELRCVEALLEAIPARARGERLRPDDAASVKLMAAKVGSRAIDDAIQVFGARGFSESFPLARMFRDVRLTRIGGGSDEMLREIIASGMGGSDPLLRDYLAGLEQGAFS